MTAIETSIGRDRSPDVLCVGIIVADLVCRPIETFPPPGGLILTDGMQLTIGGCAANVAADLAKLGRQSGIAGRVGNDVFGRHVADSLQTVGIDCSGLTYSDSSGTACTMVVNVADEDRRFIHTLGANAEFTGGELSEEQISDYRVLYVGGYGLIESFGPQRVSRLLEIARHAGLITVLDVVLAERRDFDEWFRPVLPLVDVFLPNADEAELLLAESNSVRQAEVFHEAGASTAIVTCGRDGAVLISDGACLKTPAHAVNVVDGTGSGDAFLAGYLHALLDNRPPEACLQSGSALGALCVQTAGATTGIPAAEELQRFVDDHPLMVETL